MKKWRDETMPIRKSADKKIAYEKMSDEKMFDEKASWNPLGYGSSTSTSYSMTVT